MVDDTSKFDTIHSIDIPMEPDEEPYSLEDILAEYGASRGQKILREADEKAAENAGEAEAAPQPEKPGAPAEADVPAKAAPPEKPDAPELLPSPQPISLEEVVGSTVSAVMEARRDPVLRPRRGLFSRRPLEDTEQFYEPPAPPPPKREIVTPEPEDTEVSARCKAAWRGCRATLPWAFLAALIPLCAMAAEEFFALSVPYWTGENELQLYIVSGCLALNMILCWRAERAAGAALLRGRCSGAALSTLAALVSLGDCAVCYFSEERLSVPTYAAVSALTLAFAQWGACRESRGWWDAFRTSALNEAPPYLVTDVERGACKQRGGKRGFYTTAARDGFSLRLQAAITPVILAASLVFAGLTSLSRGDAADFLLHWSAILTAGATLTLPLAWGLPWSRTARRLQRAGCAVAGWDGAERISRRRCMILSDGDLFPPGTIRLNGVKVYGEEVGRAAAYAAAMARSAGSVLEPIFNSLAVGMGVRKELASDFSFYQEGGWSGIVRGESVLLGTASFMRKMDVRLPGGVNLKTGIFMSVDGVLAAIFAVKYDPVESVDYALRILRRGRIVPVLAARDPNITPELLQRKFGRKLKMDYPDLTTRVALSEAESDQGLPRALLLREGLLVYAEAVVGSRRLCSAVRKATVFGLLGSVTGTLLTAYLVSLQRFDMLTPPILAVFLLLWTLPVLLLGDWAGRY